MSKGDSSAALDAVKKRSPKWVMAEKPEMIIGGNVPSWTKSIPGPKYSYSTDNVKNRAPQWTMREKPKMVMGDSVPSWVNSIPGPKYSYDANVVKARQPVFSMQGRDEGKVVPGSVKNRAGSTPLLSQDEVAKGTVATKDAPRSFSLCSRPKMISGDAVPSWVASIPGPKYVYSTDMVKDRRPTWTIGAKLKSESDLMKVRSPGPVYGGAAADAKKQELCDSTRHRTPAPGFGIGARWEGKGYELVRSGASARFNRPAVR